MTVIIRIGNALVADRAARSENHVFEQAKIHRIADGTIFGMAGHNPSVAMRNAATADDLIAAFEAVSSKKSGNAMLLIRPDGIAEQVWIDDQLYAEWLKDAVVSVGCYRSEWESYQRAMTSSCLNTLQIGVRFAELVNELNGSSALADVLSHNPGDV